MENGRVREDLKDRLRLLDDQADQYFELGVSQKKIFFPLNLKFQLIDNKIMNIIILNMVSLHEKFIRIHEHQSC